MTSEVGRCARLFPGMGAAPRGLGPGVRGAGRQNEAASDVQVRFNAAYQKAWLSCHRHGAH